MTNKVECYGCKKEFEWHDVAIHINGKTYCKKCFKKVAKGGN